MDHDVTTTEGYAAALAEIRARFPPFHARTAAEEAAYQAAVRERFPLAPVFVPRIVPVKP